MCLKNNKKNGCIVDKQPTKMISALWLLQLGVSGWFTGHYNFRCQPVDYSNHPKTIRMTHACWWYYFSKFTEFFDTIFFVLRKKNDHVSTLHVIHHGCMPMSVWFGVKFTPGGHSTFFGLLNTFVHIIMYTYYLLSAFGPHMQRYLWWKKYLTSLQMIQFILIVVHAFQLLFIDCNYPKAFVWWIGMHGVMFFFLFNEFYKQAYRNNQKLKAAKAAKALNGAANGILKNGMSNGTSNGTTNGAANGVSHGQKTIETSPKSAGTKVSDYYINGELTSGLHHRTGEIK